jgi:adenylate cyclase
MSGAASSASKSAKWRLNPVQVSVSIVGLVFLYTLLMWQLGWLQFLEFKSYDALIRNQPKAPTSDPIVLVEMTEADINSPTLDYPIHDGRLAELLGNLDAAKPAAIGLDVWRDLPVPKDGSGLTQLNNVLLTNANIVPIFTLDGIPAPVAVRSNADRIAYNDNYVVDFEVDRTIPKVRRCLLFTNDVASGRYLVSLPFKLATLYLEPMGIEPEPVPGDPTALRLGKTVLRPFHRNDGAYIHADDGGFQLLIDFKCPDQFVRYSVGDALAGKIRPESLRNKIVLIGMNSASVMDERVTPVKRNHRGIEVQAVVVNQLLRAALNGEKPLRFWNRWQEDIWILFWCSIGGTIGFWIRSPGLFVLAAVGCLVGLGVTVWLAFMNGLWIPAVGPAVGFVPATTLVVAYISSHERAMRRLLMKLYAGHVSKEIAEATWEDRHSFMDGGRPLAQKQVVTVLFTDLKGFSTISETMDPAHLFGWLNGYLGAMAEEIQEHGGVLKQFSGDGILALFGVPVPHTTRAEQANDAVACVRCALAMGQRLVELDRGWKAEGLPSASMRAGIYTGEVATGSIGSDERFEYTVIGDIVNTAARLESYDKSLADPDLLPNRCRLLVGAPTYDLLDGKFSSEKIGLIEVKGKANKVPVFQILDEKPAASADPSPPALSAPRNDLALANDKQNAQINS